MAEATHHTCTVARSGAEEAPLTPAAMARYLRRTRGETALCFAQAIHAESAWANETWGAYWAAVVRMVEQRAALHPDAAVAFSG